MKNETKGVPTPAGIKVDDWIAAFKGEECFEPLTVDGLTLVSPAVAFSEFEDRARLRYFELKRVARKHYGIKLSQEPWRLGESEVSQALYLGILESELSR